MNKYVIRKYDGAIWIDALAFFDERQLASSDVAEVVCGKLESGEIRMLLPAVFCLIQRLNNGRERRIGTDVSIGRDGKAIECPETKK